MKTGGLLTGLLWFCVGGATAQHDPVTLPEIPQLRIESFAPTRAYAVGMDSVTMVAVVRNAGSTALPADAATANIFSLSGLEYLEGIVAPKLPALEPGATAAFKWRLKPISDEAPLVTALALQVPGQPPVVRIVPIQHFATPPRGDSAMVSKRPVAYAGRGGGVIENNRVRARIVTTGSNVPVLFLSARTSGGWRQVGVSLPLAEVLSAEGGQRPWWEVLRYDSARALKGEGIAALTISGGFGVRWRATLEVALRADTSALDLRLRLSPLRPMNLAGLRFLPLLAGEGSFGNAASELLEFTTNDTGSTAAVRWGEITVGALWPSTPPLAAWQIGPMPGIGEVDYRLLGMEMQAAGAPTTLQPGTLIEIRGRLFALSPSKTVQDAHLFASPAFTQRWIGRQLSARHAPANQRKSRALSAKAQRSMKRGAKGKRGAYVRKTPPYRRASRR